jgi:transcriptional regulator with XRE-family HTH domain
MMEIDADIATQLKAHRSRRAWTLDQLAQASGVSRGMISKIERQQVSATAALLSRLGAALEVPLSDLLAPARSAGALMRKAERPRWQDPATGFVREVASPRLTGSAVEVVEVELPPAAKVDYRLDRTPVYAQHVLVLAGRLRIHQGPPLDLAMGDTFFMVPAGEFSFENPGGSPCRYLVIMERRQAT